MVEASIAQVNNSSASGSRSRETPVSSRSRSANLRQLWFINWSSRFPIPRWCARIKRHWTDWSVLQPATPYLYVVVSPSIGELQIEERETTVHPGYQPPIRSSVFLAVRRAPIPLVDLIASSNRKADQGAYDLLQLTDTWRLIHVVFKIVNSISVLFFGLSK
jgi:hypothetical protein